MIWRDLLMRQAESGLTGTEYVQRGSILTAADAASSDFANRVSISANGLVMSVGAYGWEGTYTNQGGVYIYDWSGSAWVQRGGVLTTDAPTSFEEFGHTTALSADGSILVVGSPNANGGYSFSGRVYVFDWSGSAWVQRGTYLAPADKTTSDNFGSGVSISGDGSILAVGAPGWEGAISNQGGVYIYDWSGSAWVQRGSVIEADDAASANAFGRSVSLSSDGSVLAVGSELIDHDSLTDAGGVYLFDWGGSSWAKRGSTLYPAGAASYDWFGFGVALSGDGLRLAVGAPQAEESGYPGGSGVVFIYDVSAATPSLIQKLAPSLDTTFGSFGRKVGLNSDGAVMVVGSDTYSGNPVSSSGAVYTFDFV